jgi:hypothetical protein
VDDFSVGNDWELAKFPSAQAENRVKLFFIINKPVGMCPIHVVCDVVELRLSALRTILSRRSRQIHLYQQRDAESRLHLRGAHFVLLLAGAVCRFATTSDRSTLGAVAS